MKWKWMIVGVAGLVIAAKVAVQLHRVMESQERDMPQEHSSDSSSHRGASRADSRSPSVWESGVRSQAKRLLRELQDSEGYPATVIQGRLTALFRDWGRRDVDAAENFLETDEAAQGTFDGGRKFREDLVFAAWIGLAEVDAEDGWRRYETMWKNLKHPMIINPGLQPLPFERAGVHLFRAWYRSDPAAGLSSLRASTPSMPVGPMLRVLMEETRDADARQRYFKEFCEGRLANQLDLGFICAGVAMHDPDQAMKFGRWGRIDEEPLTSESPLSISYSMIRFWSMAEPEKALDFIVRPEFEEWRHSWVIAFTGSQPQKRPEMVIRLLERKELVGLRDQFLMETFYSQLMSVATEWPLVDEELSLPPEERLRIMREALRDADLPSVLKARWMEDLGE